MVYRWQLVLAGITRYFYHAYKVQQRGCADPPIGSGSELIGIHWPQRISNVKLYEQCHCHEISTRVMDMLRRLFGHILRLDEKAPANQAISVYFQTDGLSRYGGRPRTSPAPLTLTRSRSARGTRADLEQLRRIAKNKTSGTNYTEQ